jgi:hypothetical protein
MHISKQHFHWQFEQWLLASAPNPWKMVIADIKYAAWQCGNVKWRT